MNHKSIIFFTLLCATHVYGITNTAKDIETKLQEIEQELQTLKQEEQHANIDTYTKFELPTEKTRVHMPAPPKSTLLTTQEISDEIDAINAHLQILDAKNITDILERIVQAYQAIYKRDRAYRKAKDLLWENFDFNKISTIPVLLLASKKKLGKTIASFLKKAHTIRNSSVKRELPWLKLILRNLQNVEQYPHVYDHYYGPIHHKLFTMFTKKHLHENYSQQERIAKEIQLLELNFKNLLQDHDKYHNGADFMKIIKQYIEWRTNKTINLPLPLYRWYGPGIPDVSYDQLVIENLSGRAKKNRLTTLKHLLQTIKNHATLYPYQELEKYRLKRLPITLMLIEEELKE